jgi:hypothetical protein
MLKTKNLEDKLEDEKKQNISKINCNPYGFGHDGFNCHTFGARGRFRGGGRDNSYNYDENLIGLDTIATDIESELDYEVAYGSIATENGLVSEPDYEYEEYYDEEEYEEKPVVTEIPPAGIVPFSNNNLSLRVGGVEGFGAAMLST